MKTRHVTPGIVVALILTGAVRLADARLAAIDIQGAICQATTAKNGVTYNTDGVTSGDSKVDVICPLNAIAMTSDSATQVTGQIKMYTSGSMTCTFTAASDGSGVQQQSFTPTAGTFAVAIGPIDQPTKDHSGHPPVEVSLWCTLDPKSTIGAIQLETVNVTTSNSPMANMMPASP